MGLGGMSDAERAQNNINKMLILQNQQNYNNQVEQQQYLRTLQNTIFEREDNSIQRRVADLKAAGLSPTLAAGSGAGAGSVVASSAPQSNADIKAYTGMPKSTEVLNAIVGALGGVSDLVYKINGVQNMKADTQNKLEQNSYIAAQTAGVKQETRNKGIVYNNLILESKKRELENLNLEIKNDRDNFDLQERRRKLDLEIKALEEKNKNLELTNVQEEYKTDDMSYYRESGLDSKGDTFYNKMLNGSPFNALGRLVGGMFEVVKRRMRDSKK